MCNGQIDSSLVQSYMYLDKEGYKECLRNLPCVKEHLLNANLSRGKLTSQHFIKELFKEDLLNPP